MSVADELKKAGALYEDREWWLTPIWSHPGNQATFLFSCAK
jgi:hypothetical protein